MQEYENTIQGICRRYRAVLGKTLMDVAADTGYSLENIAAFERGRNSNFRILLWYIDHGLNNDWCNRLQIEEDI